MIVLLSALAVVAAAIVLVVGMISGAFSLIFAGLALAVGGVVLLVMARFLGRSREAAHSEEPAPLIPMTPAGSSPEVGEWVDDPEASFPIPRYDSLWVTQIVPHLAGLSSDELAMVEARERGGRHRSGVLDAIAAVRRGDGAVPETTEGFGHPELLPVPPIDDIPEQGPPARRARLDEVARETVLDTDDDEVFVPEPAEKPASDEPDEPVEPEEPADPPAAEVASDGSGRVRTFLGRPTAPIIVQRE